MNRRAQETIRLARALVKQGSNVTPRKLERWSQDGLGPIGSPDFRLLIRHYAEVASTSTVGRDADTVARRLAARGYACERVRGAILRELGLTAESPPAIGLLPDLSSGPSGDEGFAAIEQMARAMVADTRGLPSLMVKVLQALYRNGAQRAEQLGEPADAIFHSFVVNCLAHLMGCDYYNGEALEAVLGLDSGTVSVDALDTMNSKLRICIPSLEAAYRTESLEEIALMAQRLSAWAPRLLSYLKVAGAKQIEIEDIAAVFAPAAIYYVDLLHEALDDFPSEPLPLPPAAPELPAVASG